MAVVLGSIASLIGLALLLGGLALILAHAFARDSDGYYTTGTERLATNTYALTAEDIDLGNQAADVVPADALGRIRIRAERPGGRPELPLRSRVVAVIPAGAAGSTQRHQPLRA